MFLASARTPLDIQAPLHCAPWTNVRNVLIDSGIYPVDHEFLDGQRPAKPGNLGAIRAMLSQERSSGPAISEAVFEEFVEATECDEPEKMKDMITEITRHIEGTDDSDSRCIPGFLFDNVAPITRVKTRKPKPDYVAGAGPEQLDKDIRAKLNKHIEPPRSHRLIVPNFFFQLKSPSHGRPSLRCRACYEGAFGARGMCALRLFQQANEYAWDRNAYTITATYFCG